MNSRNTAEMSHQTSRIQAGKSYYREDGSRSAVKRNLDIFQNHNCQTVKSKAIFVYNPQIERQNFTVKYIAYCLLAVMASYVNGTQHCISATIHFRSFVVLQTHAYHNIKNRNGLPIARFAQRQPKQFNKTVACLWSNSMNFERKAKKSNWIAANTESVVTFNVHMQELANINK